MSEVSKLYATDETFREVADLLFGGGADELVHKMNPDSADLSTKDRKKRAITAGLSAVGATAGAAGLGYAGYKTGQEYKKAPKTLSRAARLGRAVKSEKLGAALIPLEVAGLGGEVMATRILHGDTKKKVSKGLLTPVSKNIQEIKENASFPSKRDLTRASITTAARASGKGAEYVKTHKGALKKLPNKVQSFKQKVEKSAELDIKWEGEISKINADKQQVFGWASIVELNGEPVVDLQGDYISIDEVEKSGYEYVKKSRKGGDMHLRDGDLPVHASDMIESFIVTPEKKKALNLPDETPVGWWVGYQVNDPEVWAKVKSGERTGFSIHGRGQRS